MIQIVRAVQTSMACPSQWDAWDVDGRYLYLRYRCGVGTVDTYEDEDWTKWESCPSGGLVTFEHGDPIDGYITLEDFMSFAGMEWSKDEVSQV